MNNAINGLRNTLPFFAGHGSEASSSHDAELPNSFLTFAMTAERVCATAKRAEKSECVAAYFETLEENDLMQAARYLSGQIFPLHEARTLSVGPATLIAAIAGLVRLDPKDVRAESILRKDLADVARDLFERYERKPGDSLPLTLLSVYKALDEISSTHGTKQKTARVMDILRAATPLEAKYLVKMISGELRIGLQEGTVEEAISRWTGTEIARVQHANMLSGDIGSTAVLAQGGRLDAARLRVFHPIKFMLATATDLHSAARQLPDLFLVEDKFNGVRVQAHIGLDLPETRDAPGRVHAGIRVALFSKTLEDVSDLFPDLIPALSGLLPDSAGTVDANGLILDGEIIPISDGKIFPLSTLRKLMEDASPSPSANSAYAAFIAYDILCREGRALLQEPLTTRAAALEDLLYDRVRTWRAAARRFTDTRSLAAELEAALARGNEGIMLKDPQASYRPGRRSDGWLKVETALATLDVVVTAAEVGGRGTKHLSDYTFAVRTSQADPRLLEIGRARIGLSDQDVVQLADWFRAHTIQQYAQGKVRRVVPQIVLEVTFSNVKTSRRYDSGYALQQPCIVRIRRDKPVSEIDTLETVQRLAVPSGEDRPEKSAS